MGAGENAELVRRGYEAFNSGDMTTLAELFDEAAVWHLPGAARSPTTTRAARRLSRISPAGTGAGGTFRAGLEHLLADDGDRVVGIQRNTGSVRASNWVMTP